MILLLIILIFLIGCTSEGSKVCKTSSDCKTVDGCDSGCYNKWHLPRGNDNFCGNLGPSSCGCINNKCMMTTHPLMDSCNDYLCISREFKINKSEMGFFHMTIFNHADEEHTFHLNVTPITATDHEKNKIENNLKAYLYSTTNKVTLGSKKSIQNNIFVQTDEETQSGRYMFNLSLTSDDINMGRLFFLIVE